MTKKEHRPDVVFMQSIDNEGNLRLTPFPSLAYIAQTTANIPIKLDFGKYKGTGITITPAEIAALLAEYRAKHDDKHSIGYTVADDMPPTHDYPVPPPIAKMPFKFGVYKGSRGIVLNDALPDDSEGDTDND